MPLVGVPREPNADVDASWKRSRFVVRITLLAAS
jgi:hypothetical protein